ncbi:MAG: diguanylate cyclase [Nitrospirae bacterium]|nr:diguanylate cyclase [Nitrospirota bacterium]
MIIIPIIISMSRVFLKNRLKSLFSGSFKSLNINFTPLEKTIITSILNPLYCQIRDLLININYLWQSKKELELILEITRSVSSSLDINEVLRTMVNRVGLYIDADRCSIILVDPQREHGYVVASHDVPDVNQLQIELIKYPEIRKALETGETVIINDISEDNIMMDVREIVNQADIKSLLVIPISYQSEIIGTLLLKVVADKRVFTAEEIRFCQIIANTSANAIKNAQLFEEVKMQASTDGLTKLLNHRAFLEMYQQEVIRSQRTQKGFSLIMIDIDNFKSANDVHGHYQGDRILREVAQCLKDNTRSIDTIGRYGGDEYICLLPDASHDQGMLVADRILSKVRERFQDDSLGVSISLGLSTLFYHTDDQNMLIQFADQAMYLAKYRGGNQVFSFDCTETRDLNLCNQKLFETFIAVKALKRFDNSQHIVSALEEQLGKMFSKDASPQSLFEIVTSLSSALDARDHYTNGHSERAIDYAREIARAINMSQTDQEELVYLCLLHDIGKIGIPDHILNKPGKLTPEEFEIMKRHAEIGEKIISPLEMLRRLKPLIRHHQEFYDGSGYPDGLSGEAIPLACRILAVVDTFDAMTTDRPYRKALSIETAVAELQRCSGSQFDPGIVEVFIRILETEAVGLK